MANAKFSLKSQLGGITTVTTSNTANSGIVTFPESGKLATEDDVATILENNITVNVGTGQQFTTINQALEYLTKTYYPIYKKNGITATINLKTGFVMQEQVLVSGIDLGWITITGEDAETIITHTALTTAFNGEYPAFGVDKGGTSPIIGQLFRFNVEKVDGSRHGLMASGAGSSANVLSGKGFIGAGANGIYAIAGSTVSASGANCSNAGANGVYAGGGSTVNAGGANCSNAVNTAIYANTGSRVNANGANCSNAGANGVYASSGSTINIEGTMIRNQTTGTSRVYVRGGSTINALNIDSSGGTVTVFSQAVNTLTSNGIIFN